MKRLAVFLAVLFSAFIVSAQKTRTFKLEALSPRFSEIVASDSKLETVATGFGFTEGPMWDPAGFLYVSDETINKIFRVYPEGKKEEVIALGDPDGNTLDRRHRLIDPNGAARTAVKSPDLPTRTVGRQNGAGSGIENEGRLANGTYAAQRGAGRRFWGWRHVSTDESVASAVWVARIGPKRPCERPCEGVADRARSWPRPAQPRSCACAPLGMRAVDHYLAPAAQGLPRPAGGSPPPWGRLSSAG